MLFYMNSRIFQKEFLLNEDNDDILKAQYVIVSSRIFYKNDKENILQARNTLYPDPNVSMTLTKKDFKYRYYEQLDNSKVFLATLIKASIEEKYNIIFLCTKNEDKMRYLEYLSNYIYIEFGYPCYEYGKYCSGASKLIHYNKDKVLKKCNSYLKDAKRNYNKSLTESEEGRKKIIKEYKKMKSKELKKILKKHDLYSPELDKEEMIELIITFIL